MGTKIGSIGGGNIVRAILSGVALSNNYEENEIGVFDLSSEVRAEYKAKGYETYKSNEEVVANSEVVVVAVLPQVMRSIVPQIKSAYSEKNVFISLAAGITNQWWYDNIGKDVKVVQCVPTLTAQVGMGAYAIDRSNTVNDEDYKKACDFLTSSGIVEETPASLMQEVIPIGGAAPAYFYHIADVVVKEAVQMGLDEKTALHIFAQTMKGSAEMLLNSEESPKALEKKLLLPGAATLAAINKMKELGFDETWKEGIQACVAQARNLAKL
ncbi:pyrroline-5-carboxylate reductase dimerization domain-containing protein [Niallia alba]|uniref:pyrroline-5-carboxylate reductase family protein n=1 Tax=Niallia alba TaxID=2729105 RepID=UPI0039A3E387